jgi:two-component system, cell cycle response regulator DivK
LHSGLQNVHGVVTLWLQKLNGARVLDAVAEYAPDLITMEIQLPNISGRTLIREIRRDPDTRDIPILAMTAFAGRDDEAQTKRAGADGFIPKPLTIERLLDEVNRLLDQRDAA